MKRIIDGKAYNTETAQLIAKAHYTYDKLGDDDWECHVSLYRTKGGAFFQVEIDNPTDPDDDRTHVTFTPKTYDAAHRFARGEDNVAVELLAEGIFPSVPEAEEVR